MRIPARLMPHKVTVTTPGVQTPGGVTPGADVETRAYVEDVDERVATAAGTETVSPTSAWLDPDTGVHVGGTLTVTTGPGAGDRRRVLAVNRFRHPGAPSHDVARLE
ncbi:MAG: hypothetical protein ACTH31_15910 [Pseudoclavibacter sp.]